MERDFQSYGEVLQVALAKERMLALEAVLVVRTPVVPAVVGAPSSERVETLERTVFRFEVVN